MNLQFRSTTGFLAVILSVCGLTATAHAHPGHDLGSANAWHIATSPYHLAVLALFGVGFLVAGTWVQRTVPARVLRGLGSMAVGCAIILWGLS